MAEITGESVEALLRNRLTSLQQIVGNYEIKLKRARAERYKKRPGVKRGDRTSLTLYKERIQSYHDKMDEIRLIAHRLGIDLQTTERG